MTCSTGRFGANRRRYEEDDPYFGTISGIWSTGLLRVFAEVPDVTWN